MLMLYACASVCDAPALMRCATVLLEAYKRAAWQSALCLCSRVRLPLPSLALRRLSCS